MVHRITVVVAAVSLVACTASQQQMRSTAADRAAFDLDCPADQITAQQLGDTVIIGRTPENPGLQRTVFGVSGCDQKAVYVVECVGGSSCNAILNADTKPAR